MPTLAESVRAARKDMGWSQEVLADHAGLNKETVMRIERGEDARLATVDKIKQVLPGVDGAPRPAPQADSIAMEVSALADRMAGRIGFLVRGIASLDRLQAVRTFVLQQLQDERLDEESDIRAHGTAARAMNDTQENAERGLVASSHKRRGRKGNGKSDGGAQ